MTDPTSMTLPPELEKTHELVTTHYDEAKTKVRLVYVAPKGKQNVNDGPWQIFREDGRLWAERVYKDGGVWSSGTSYGQDGQVVDSGKVEEGEGRIRYHHGNDATQSEGDIHKGRNHGLWIYLYADGTKKAEGTFDVGQKTGTWEHWNDQGEIRSKEIYEGDRLQKTWYDEKGRPSREESLKKGAQGQWVEDGPTRYYDKGRLRNTTYYEMGAFIRHVQNPEPVIKAMNKHNTVREQLKAMNAAASGRNLQDYYEGLHETGKMSAELAVAVYLECYEWPQVLPFLETYGEEAVAYLKAAAEEQLQDEYPDSSKLSSLVVGLWAAGGKRPLDLDAWGTALFYGMRSYSDNSHKEQVAILREIVAGYPEADREDIVLCNHARNDFARGKALPAYASLAPTPAVIGSVIERVLSFQKSQLNHPSSAVDTAMEVLSEVSDKAAPQLMETLAGKGKKAPAREILIKALAKAGLPESASTLLEFADDKVDGPREAARKGLAELGAGALPALETALGGRKKKLKAYAAELLAELPLTEEVQAVAAARLKKEKDKALKAQLEQMLAGEATPKEVVLPEGQALLARMREELSDARRQELLGALQPDKGHSFVDTATRNQIAEDLAAAVVYADRFGQYLTREEPEMQGLRWDSIIWAITQHEGQDLFRGWLAAELLVKFEEKGFFNLKYVLESYEKAAGPRLAEGLAWHLAQGAAPARKLLLRWLVDNAPAEGVPAFVAAAGDDQKACRALAVDGLAAAGPVGLDAAYPLLSGSPKEQAIAAAALQAAPTERSIEPLEKALAAEKKKKAKELLASALLTCQLASGKADISKEELDAALAARKAKPKSLAKLGGIEKLPEIRFLGGPALSDGAKSWLLWAAEQEGPGQPNQELWAIRKLLEDEGCVALSKRILGRMMEDSKNKWVRYQRAVLGDDNSMLALGGRLGGEASSYTAFAVLGVDVLQRSGSPSAVRWLDFYSVKGRGKLKRAAKEAFDALVARRGLGHDDLVDMATPTEDSKKNRKELIERLTGAMIGGRKWQADRWRAFFLDNPLAATLAKSLVFAAHKEEGEPTLFRISPESKLVDIEGQEVALEQVTAISLPHPVDIVDDDLLDRWIEAMDEQAFDQLGRPFERDAVAQLADALPASITTSDMLKGLPKLGYTAGSPQDAGMVYDFIRPLVRNLSLVVEHDGYYAGDRRNLDGPTSKINGAWLRGDQELTAARRPAAMSEALTDLRSLIPTL